MEKSLRDILKQEGVVRNEPAMWIKEDGVTEHGRLILTGKRLFFARNMINTSSFSRYFINEQELHPIIEIDLDSINTITQEQLVVDPNILSIRYMQYEQVKLSVIDYNDWESDIQRTRMNPDIPGDPNRRQEAA